MTRRRQPDPTANVRALIAESARRQDDVRAAEIRRLCELMAAERHRVDGRAELRATFEQQLNIAETKRIDAIRAVDVNAVSVANERATAQATVLANQVAVSADALRSLVATTADTVARQLVQMSTQITERLSLLEKAQYEAKGAGGGTKDTIGWVAAGFMALVTIGGIVWNGLK